jgi:type I restriction enzyme S subunit
MASLNQEIISRIAIRTPTISTQLRIVSVLDAFDKVIEINEQRIALLEGLARSLYREWFVHFRFPGHEDVEFVDSELGRIPDGWEVRSSEAVLTPLGGGTPSKKRADYWNGGLIPWFTPTDLTRSRVRYVADSQSQITTLGLKESGARMFPAGSVLMTSRATLGVLAIATKESTCNQGFIVIPPVDGIPSEFIYEWLANHETRLAAIATGATFREITKAAFKRFPFLLPTRPVLAMFAEAVGPVGEQISGYERGNRVLAATRDLLLPRLVTGRLDISDIDLGGLLTADAA